MYSRDIICVYDFNNKIDLDQTRGLIEQSIGLIECHLDLTLSLEYFISIMSYIRTWSAFVNLSAMIALPRVRL